MSIELHCPQCQKLIRAPNEAGGKRGKCPYCKNSLYIPLPADEVEEVALAPLDTEDEHEAEQLRRESARFAAEFSSSAVPAAEADGGDTSVRDADAAAGRGGIIDAPAEVEAFIVAMRDSQLEEAEAAVSRLKRAGSEGRECVEGLMLGEMLPEFEHVPTPVVKGLLKKLLSQLG